MSIYLCGETGIINRGCEAIIRSTLKLVEKRNGDIYLVTSAPEMDLPLVQELGINLIKYTDFPTKYHRYYAAIMRRIGHSVDGKFLQAQLFSHLTHNDLCLNIGGDTYCYGRPSVSIELNNYTSKNGINNILWCCSVEYSAITEEVLDDLKKYKYIFAREKITYENLIKAGINRTSIVKCCDPAFFLDKKKVELPNRFVIGNTVGINISEMIVSSKYPNAYPSIIQLIKEILDKTDMTVCLIPHVYSIEKNLCDWPILMRIYREIHSDRICIVDKEYNCEQLKYIISKCRFMIAARTHASIAAYSSEVPTLVLGYSIKSKGIAQDLFETDVHYVVPNEEITEKRLSDDFWFIFHNEQSIRNRLNDLLPNYRSQLLEGLKVLDKVVDNSNTICDKNLCTGCQACKMICPHDCISMKIQENGFLYPVIDYEKCVLCGKCQRVCPVANRYKDDRQEPECYVAINKEDNIRIDSSSGGVFSELARYYLNENGLVFGAVLDDTQNVNIVSCSSDDMLNKARGAKYVQADVQKVYAETENALKKGKKVLFTGTPCQIGGLYAYLGVDYENLVTIDMVCHGIPSPKAWEDYKNKIEANYGSKIKNVSFRCKDSGWQVYSLKIVFQNGEVFQEKVSENLYLKAFINHLTVRPSCFECSYKQIHRQSDITLSDFWGIGKWNASLNDDKGVSAIFIHSQKGKKLFEKVKDNFRIYEISFQEAIIDNPSYVESCDPSPFYKAFIKQWKNKGFYYAVNKFSGSKKRQELYQKLSLITNWKWK